MTSNPLDAPEPTQLFHTPDPMNPGPFTTPSVPVEPVIWTSGSEKPLNKLEVEDEVLAAVEEGKEDAESHQETEAAQTKAEASEEASKVAREKKNKLLRGNPIFIADLRRSDTPDNRVCGYCLSRKPLDDFSKGKKSNFCIDCEGR